MIATLGGIGNAPKAPGTAASLAVLPLLWALTQTSPVIYAIAVLAVFGLSIYAAQQAGAAFGNTDDGRIVIDEAVGMGIACFDLEGQPLSFFALAFVAFRVFDIVKPWPANYFDRRVKSGFGTIMDDVVAGVYALLSVYLLKWVWPNSF